MPVITQFILDVKNQKQTKGDTDGQSKNVEKTVPFISLEIPQCNQKKVFYHD
jgi:hypothetical protein